MKITVTKDAEVPSGYFCGSCKQMRSRTETASKEDFGGLSDGTITFYECMLFDVLLQHTPWKKDVGIKIIKCRQCQSQSPTKEV